jgi:hypothetical protein
MDTKAVGRTEYPWVARLREAGYAVRTGSGELNRDPDDSFTPPPGFRPGVRAWIGAVLRSAWKGGARGIHRLTHPEDHATVP